MIKNYLKVAYRNLSKHKGYAFINISGLAIGLACCLLILIYIFKELSYDRFHTNSDRIYRLVRTMDSETRHDETATTSFPAGPALASEYPHLVEATVRFYNLQVPKLSLGFREKEIYYKEPNFFFVDSTFFDVFTAELTRGNPEEALTDPQSLVITESMARKYFGDEDPVGRRLFFEGRIDLTVTGVMEDLPDNSHIQIDFIASMNTLDIFYKSDYDYSWYWNPCWTYVLLNEDTQARELQDQLPLFVEKYHDPNTPATDQATLELQPITDIYLHSNRDQEVQANSNIRYIYIFSIAAILILFIACVNFMNLSTARSARRSKEVGMRKILGADRLRLFLQFMGESYLMSFLAILLSLLVVYLTLPFFNSMLGTELQFQLLGNGWVFIGLLLLFVLVGTLSGIYPAVFLSGFRPIRTLRGDLTKSLKGQLFRRVLVVLQFGFSILLIIGTAIVYQQLNLLREKNLGFEKEEIVIMPTDLTRTIWYYDDFSQMLLQNPHIKSVTGTKNVLGSLKNIYHKYTPEGHAQPMSIPSIFVMYDFFETYDINLLAGRSFSREYSTDRTQAVIINKQLVEEMNWGTPRDALGKSLTFEDQVHYVVGVTENFNHTSLRREIEPLILDMPDEEYDIVSRIEYIAAKVDGQYIDEALDHIRSSWSEFDTSHPFDYFFHDEQLDQIYKKEESMASVSASFSILAIVIACLGLFGFISYMVETRSREIGIRKALGASIADIISMLSKEYVILIMVASLLAWPAAYYLAVRWLEDFPYRIDLGINAALIFIGSGMVALALSMATVSYQSIKAAMINPADMIREE